MTDHLSPLAGLPSNTWRNMTADELERRLYANSAPEHALADALAIETENADQLALALDELHHEADNFLQEIEPEIGFDHIDAFNQLSRAVCAAGEHL